MQSTQHSRPPSWVGGGLQLVLVLVLVVLSAGACQLRN
jgi:hypothetical protein